MGTHSELLEKKGLYYTLVTTQLAGHEDDEIFVEEKEIKGVKQFLVRKSIPNEDEEIFQTVLPPEDNDVLQKLIRCNIFNNW